ncbi:hypothetical protein F5Y08DRAFT_332264 [Xylaria arbuscula]|nr:hypothetical protein F5Y08DRAFT_332264 [Xylaria arbuscula]
MEPTTLPDKVLKRRAQNASAQRIYRAKQKQKMQRLETLTIAALTSSSSSLMGGAYDINYRHHENAEQAFTQSQALRTAEQLLDPPDPSSLENLFPLVHALYKSITPRERRTYHVITMRERFSIRDVIKYGLIKLGYAMNPNLFESAKHASTRAWLAQVNTLIDDNVDVMTVFAAGVKLLSSFPLPPSMLRNEDGDEDGFFIDEEEMMRRIVFAPRESSILSNRVTLTTVSLGSAFFANATLLGIPIPSLMDYEDAPAVQPQALLCTKPDLVPTPAQLAIPHHPTIDVIPWPAFRSNVCIALAHDPPLIDDDELCLDFMNDGVRCWGSAAGDSLHGRGQGAPWDQRSWEAAPWFLEKYKALTDEEMWRNSEWWRAIRG